MWIEPCLGFASTLCICEIVHPPQPLFLSMFQALGVGDCLPANTLPGLCMVLNHPSWHPRSPSHPILSSGSSRPHSQSLPMLPFPAGVASLLFTAGLEVPSSCVSLCTSCSFQHGFCPGSQDPSGACHQLALFRGCMSGCGAWASPHLPS